MTFSFKTVQELFLTRKCAICGKVKVFVLENAVFRQCSAEVQPL